MATLYTNGTILTMNDACPQVQAVLVENGRIEKIGTTEELLKNKSQDTVCVDLRGKTMLPGFIDGHSHFSGLATSLSQCDLSRAENLDEIVQLLKEFLAKNQIADGQWIVGANYDHNFLSEKRHPDRDLLDLVSTKHPIVIIHASSHMGAANSLALKMQNITADTPAPAGGHYGRKPGTMIPNGYLEENAFLELRNAMPMPDIMDIMEQFKKAQEIYASYGITTVQEGMVTAPLLQMLKYAEKNHVFYLDVAGYLDLETCGDLLMQHEEYQHQYRNHLKLAGYKIFLDGSPQGRTAWMKEPYADSEEAYCGYPAKSDEQVYELILKALQNGQQLLAHCNGDAAAEQYLTQFENVLSKNPELTPHRPVMIHAQLVQKEQLDRMIPLSMMPSFFAAHTYYWGDIHIQNFGMERAKNISPAGSALRVSLPFTFHQDSPVLMPDVLETIWCAAKRVTKTGVELAKDERVSIADALKAVTVNAAYQYGEEKEKGTIEEGKIADLIILDRNPIEVSTEDVRKIKVLGTIKNGSCVFQYGQ